MITKEIQIGAVCIGGGNPVAIQSMLCCAPQDIAGNIAQAKALQAAGCQIVRIAVPDANSIELLRALKAATTMPVVADIHFDYRLAILAAQNGADKIRLNPGNIGSRDHVQAVVAACKVANIPIRVGANSGSIPAHVLAQHGGATGAAMAQSALEQVAILEEADFNNIVISVKASHVPTMVEACRIIAKASAYPQHLGVTEAGTPRRGIIKSAIGIGSLLLDGIGDTIRVSLTADPVQEIAAAKIILSALDKAEDGAEVISCPTCGRCKVDVIHLAQQVEAMTAGCKKPLKIAVMGCAVNGPGEARTADIGIAGGDGECLLFKKGQPICKYPQSQILAVLRKEIDQM